MKGGSALVTPGVNDITGGVTIDLSKFNSINLDTKMEITAIGGGAKWGDVYKVLNPRGYAVAGGQGSNVGVGGMTIGGGLSFYSARYGFTCDNVQNFEIVLANGTITNANAQQNPDLFKALKGGSGNFGIVTCFSFYTFKTGPLWGGIAVYPFTSIKKFYQPTVDFTVNNAKNPDAQYIISWTNNATANTTAITNAYAYTGNATAKPYYLSTDPPSNHPKPYPSPLAEFEPSKVGTPSLNTLRITSLYDLTYELNGPNNTRILISNTAFRADVATLAHVDGIAQEVLRPYMENPKKAPYVLGQVLYEVLPRVYTDHSIQRGGNVLGLDRVKNDSIILDLLFQWTDASKDKDILNLANTVITKVVEYTKSVPGAFRDFQYLGEANPDQDPIGSYGPGNVKFLKKVSREYDPGQVFQNLVPGAFTLRDAGERGEGFEFNHFVGTGGN